MKRLIIIFVLLVAFLLVSCNTGDIPDGGSGESGENQDNNGQTEEAEKEIDLITEGYVFVYNAYKKDELEVLQHLCNQIESKLGESIDFVNFSSAETDKEIQFGSVSNRDACSKVQSELKRIESDLQAYAISVVDQKVVISATTNVGLKLASEKLLTYVANGEFKVPADLNQTYVFDELMYRKENVLVEFLASELKSNAAVSSISVNGKLIGDFSYSENSYRIPYSAAENYPKVDASSVSSEAVISLTQASDATNGVATVDVLSSDGKANKTFSVQFYIADRISADSSEIVNKDGVGGVVTFVFDDGDRRTADIIVTDLLPKYKDVTVNFAIVTEALAKLVQSADGKEWLTDADGDYVYELVKNTYDSSLASSEFRLAELEYVYEFWNKVLECGRAELLSHSHTHLEWGSSDDVCYGGEDGQSIIYPAGNVTKELKASAQILKELCNQKSLGYIKPGVGHCSGEKYYLDLIESCGIYIGARTTKTTPWDFSQMVNYASFLEDLHNRFNIYAYAVQHYATQLAKTEDGSVGYTTEYGDSIEKCLEAGIPLWTGYIDEAVKTGGWACFCLHLVVPDDVTTNAKHYIYESQLDMLFSHSQTLSDKGELWIASYSDAQKYYNEWASAEIKTTFNSDKSVEVSITDGLDDTIYDMPLTVKVAVPKGWSSAEYSYRGETEELVLHKNDDGTQYVFVNVVPDVEIAIITE